MQPDLQQLEAFVNVAKTGSFRRSAATLNRDPSTISHAIGQLEEKIGLRLLNRTTRSVSLTDAGSTFLAKIDPTLNELRAAYEAMNRYRDNPAGKLRITASHTAYLLALKPILSKFASDYPAIVLEISIDDGYVDIAREGFDAGIRLGGSIAADMTSVRATADMRHAVVATPDYFNRWGRPQEPSELSGHRCIQYRLVAAQTISPWTFAKGRRRVDLAVNGALILNAAPLMLDAALEGAGVAMVLSGIAVPHIADGRLESVLDEWCPAIPGFRLYYPGRRNKSAALKALVDSFQGQFHPKSSE